MNQYLSALLLAVCLLLSACAASPALETGALPAAEESAAPSPSPAPQAQEPSDETPEERIPVLRPEETGKLCISELMSKNRATWAAEDGGFYDWVEIRNISDAPVSLDGWALSDGPGEPRWALPSLELAPGDCLAVFASGDDAAPAGAADFGLSEGETLCLFAPSGAQADSLVCPALRSDEALARRDDGSFRTTLWATPGYPNSDEGYEAFSASRRADGPLVISEVMSANVRVLPARGAEREDWVELKNISAEPVRLEDYLLWDGGNDVEPFRLPAGSLSPGERVVIVCGGDGPDDAPFALDAGRERLYLATADGICDYLALHDLPVNGSCGRMDGRDGFFYFAEATPGDDNKGGLRMVSEEPEPLNREGVFNNVESVSVELVAPGRIHYSTDGSLPTEDDSLLEAPLSLSKTTVLRAVAVEDGKLPSRAVTLSFIINEDHTLPVISLCTDDPAAFRGMYNGGYKGRELPACFTLFENGESLKSACGVQMSGSGSLALPKKSMALMFRSCYGDGNLDYDLFGTGVTRYASLQLRAGEAYPTSIIQSDLFQDICLSMSDSALTQHSKFCAVYVNGRYYGLFCLKEKFSEQYYASLRGVSKSSVSVVKYPAPGDSDFYREVIDFCNGADLSDPEQYRDFCSRVNVDSLIDWYLIEGLSANPDVGGNVRMLRSTEDGLGWSFALYDLDWGFLSSTDFFYNLNSTNYYHAGQAKLIMEKAMQNEQFRDRILTRYAEVYDTALSNEAFLARIDAYEQLLAPELPRERERWGGTAEAWRLRLDMLRDYIRSSDPQRRGVENFCRIWGISAETRAQYFGW